MEASYIASLTEQETIAYELARTKLGSSFDMTKSIGFLKNQQSQKGKEPAKKEQCVVRKHS